MITQHKRKRKSNVHTASKKTKLIAGKTNSVVTRIRKIGNSKGILLSNHIINELGVKENAEAIVKAEKGAIIIIPAEAKRKINTDLSAWEAQFKVAIKNGDKPEADMFGGIKISLIKKNGNYETI